MREGELEFFRDEASERLLRLQQMVLQAALSELCLKKKKENMWLGGWGAYEISKG